MTHIQLYLAQNLKEKRIEINLSQAALAEKIGSSGNYIAQIERGEKYPSPGMIERIAEALGIDSAELFTKTKSSITNPWNL